jgi:hypothetical protein
MHVLPFTNLIAPEAKNTNDATLLHHQKLQRYW